MTIYPSGTLAKAEQTSRSRVCHDLGRPWNWRNLFQATRAILLRVRLDLQERNNASEPLRNINQVTSHSLASSLSQELSFLQTSETISYGSTLIKDHARAILGNLYQSHKHVYPFGRIGPIDPTADRTTKLIQGLMTVVENYKADEAENTCLATAEDIGALVATALSECSSPRSLEESLRFHSMTDRVMA